jgi:hypothetical protein
LGADYISVALGQAASFVWFASLASASVEFWRLAIPMALTGIGPAMVLPVVPTAALSAVERARMGKASGVNSTLKRFGGAFGVAVATSRSATRQRARYSRATSPARDAWRKSAGRRATQRLPARWQYPRRTGARLCHVADATEQPGGEGARGRLSQTGELRRLIFPIPQISRRLSMLNELGLFLGDLRRGQWRRALSDNRVFRSLFRTGYPSTPRQQALIMFNNVFLHLHPVRIRRESLKITYTFCLGGLFFFLFLLLTVTGVLLMFYYRPATSVAYQDMKDLNTLINFGLLLRNIHRYSAHGMVIVVFLHMLRVFYTGSYRPPREFNWFIGAILLFCTFFLSFTGYLLPWDQLGIWAVTVGTNMAGATPFVGDQVRFLLIGGYEIGESALVRWYVLHVMAVPLVTAVLMAVHFWRIRKDGGISGPL